MLDRATVRRRFARAAPRYGEASRLEAEVGARMLERLEYIKLRPQRVLDAGCGPAREAAALSARYPGSSVVLLDVALPMLRTALPARSKFSRMLRRERRLPVCAEMERLPLAAASVGLAWSNMALHWAADPVRAIAELHRVLVPGGLLILSTLGPDTLKELRAIAGPARVHSFTDMHDVGDQLVAAGFTDPVMEAERLTLTYAASDVLLADLRASGQTCALTARARGLSGRRFLARLREALDAGRRDGRLAATFEVVYGHAWKPLSPSRTSDGRAIVRFERKRTR
ncbi:MAG TPA: methyltransferase domain-containing protein [Burkholderiales bacterium]|nr:methyltransferase domain-containing protein [Burkholderiales bacterium]